ncbi:uncharacterized protein LOC126687757 [Mercurialis annua]|uniref:uncharacterized protein LOC126687757 n=1 Tax=Mercurialis annua TaxID=3986 RepID=UPI002160905E|nr:uncharacterized protein LOC126687757 [Mercurialis annua]
MRTNDKLKPRKQHQPQNFIQKLIKILVFVCLFGTINLQTEYGDVYDCMDINKQHALNHPALTNHTIMLKPSKELEDRMLAHEPLINSSLGLKRGCPFGRVPIRRSPKISPITKSWNHGWEFAGLYTSKGEYHGSRGAISIYKPKINVNSKCHSSAMISFESGDGLSLNQIQVGWTSDSYQRTGCYNMFCSGFVLISPNFPLDMVLTPSSVREPPTYEIWFDVSQDKETGAWWLGINKEYIVGYWPKEIFTSLNQFADTLRWGGEIFTPSSEDSSPQMGSGLFQNTNYDSTCFVQQIDLLNSHFNTIIPDESFIQISESRCYFEGDQSYKNDIGYSFLFGGKGGTEHNLTFSIKFFVGNFMSEKFQIASRWALVPKGQGTLPCPWLMDPRTEQRTSCPVLTRALCNEHGTLCHVLSRATGSRARQLVPCSTGT